jgi:hypothetical protein
MDRHLCALAVCLLVPACRISVPEGVLPCASELDCPVTWSCSHGTCVQRVQVESSRAVNLFDASVHDTSALETHVPEAGPRAVSMLDASMPKPQRDASTPRTLDAAVSGKPAPPVHEEEDDAGCACDASAAPECHADSGAQCGGLCDTPGRIQCDGSCSNPDPVEYGDECGHCGGHVLCDSSCDFPDPAHFGELCSDLVSSVGCSGRCECVRQCPNGQLVPCVSLCPILCPDGLCNLP